MARSSTAISIQQNRLFIAQLRTELDARSKRVWGKTAKMRSTSFSVSCQTLFSARPVFSFTLRASSSKLISRSEKKKSLWKSVEERSNQHICAMPMFKYFQQNRFTVVMPRHLYLPQMQNYVVSTQTSAYLDIDEFRFTGFFAV